MGATLLLQVTMQIVPPDPPPPPDPQTRILLDFLRLSKGKFGKIIKVKHHAAACLAYVPDLDLLQPVPQAMAGYAAANKTPPQASIMAQCANIEKSCGNHRKVI